MLERANERFNTFIQSADNRETYNNYVHNLLAHGYTQEDTLRQTQQHFITEYMEEDKENNLKEVNDTIRQWEDHLSVLEQQLGDVEQQLGDVEQQLSLYEGNY